MRKMNYARQKKGLTEVQFTLIKMIWFKFI